MAALVPIKPGGYDTEDPILHTEMNLINTQIVKAPNFVDGDATYSPAVTVTIEGNGLTFNSTTAARWGAFGYATFQSGSKLIQNSGARLELSGTTTWKTGALATLEVGSQLDVESIVEFQDGSFLNTVGAVTFNLVDVTTINENGTIYFGPTALVVALDDAQIAWNTGSVFTDGSTRTFSGSQTPSGDNAQVGQRIQDLTSGTVVRGAEKDTYYVAHAQGGLLVVKLRDDPAPLVDGAVITFIWESSDGLNSAEFQEQDATPIITRTAGASFSRIQFQWRNSDSAWHLYDVNPVTAFDFTP